MKDWQLTVCDRPRGTVARNNVSTVDIRCSTDPNAARIYGHCETAVQVTNLFEARMNAVPGAETRVKALMVIPAPPLVQNPKDVAAKIAGNNLGRPHTARK